MRFEYAVKPVNKGHSVEPENVPFIEQFSCVYRIII
jgi:hypothetical protein